MPSFEWTNVFTGQRATVYSAHDALMLASQRDQFGQLAWVMIDPANPRSFPLQPVGPPPPSGGVFQPNTNTWTTANVHVGPFTIDDWFAGSAPAAVPAVTPGLLAVYYARPDLQAVYNPDGSAIDASKVGAPTLVEWWNKWGKDEYPALDPATALDPSTVVAAAAPGVITPGVINVANANSYRTVDNLVDLSQAIDSGFSVMRDDGRPAIVQSFMGGYLVDGNPLNVLLGEGWSEGQWDAVQAAVAAGTVPAPTLPPSTATPGTLLAIGAAVFGLVWLTRKMRRN